MFVQLLILVCTNGVIIWWVKCCD